MPRYFFNARRGSEVVIDTVGVEIESLASVHEYIRSAAVECALDLDQAWQFEIVDATGELQQVVPISDLADVRH